MTIHTNDRWMVTYFGTMVTHILSEMDIFCNFNKKSTIDVTNTDFCIFKQIKVGK